MDPATTDFVDNYNRVEVTQGVDLVGSGNGLKMLCGNLPKGGFNVDFARSSKYPVGAGGANCSDIVGLGYAKDGVPELDFPDINPSVYGATITCTAQASADTGCTSGNTYPLGPVAAGWLPGDPVNGPYSGTAFTDISNIDLDGGGGYGSEAFRLYCTHAAAPPTRAASGRSRTGVS